MKCSNCGATQESGTLFCKNCGHNLQNGGAVTDPSSSVGGSSPNHLQNSGHTAITAKKPSRVGGWVGVVVFFIVVSVVGAMQDEWSSKKAKEETANVIESVIREEPLESGVSNDDTEKIKAFLKDVFEEYRTALQQNTVAVVRASNNPRLLTYESFATISEMSGIVTDLKLALKELDSAQALYVLIGNRVEQKINASSFSAEAKPAMIEAFKKSFNDPVRTELRNRVDADAIALFSNIKQIYELLINNFDDYELYSDGIYFQTDSVMNRYNDLIDKHTAASEKYLADTAELEKYQNTHLQELGTDITSEDINKYFHGQ